jgi:anti-sigma B factor antagonist
MNTQLDLEVRHADDGVPTLVARGEVDMTNADDLGEALSEAADGQSRIVVDLSEVRYLDSAGLSVLFVQAVHTDVELLVGDPLTQIVRISGLDKVTTVTTPAEH